MGRKLYSFLRGLIRPFLAHTEGVDLLIHDDGVRKFVSESYYDFSTFKELDEMRGEERNLGWKSH